MDIIVKSLFNNGYNDGDITILTNDSDFRCHSFVVCRACPTLKTMYEYAKKEKDTEDLGPVIMATEYSTKVVKYLISMLYNHELAGNDTFLDFISEVEDMVMVDPKTSIKSIYKRLYVKRDRVVEYIKARDYFGVEYGSTTLHVAIDCYDALSFIKALPCMSIYDPLRKYLYEAVYSNLDTTDLSDEKFSFVFTDLEMCKEIMMLYNKKAKVYKRQ